MRHTTTLPVAIRYLTNAEAARFLRLSPRTLEKNRILGAGPRFHKFDRRVLYAVADVEAWAARRGHYMTTDADDGCLR